MRVRSTFTAALVLVLAGALAGCGSDDTSADTPSATESDHSEHSDGATDESDTADAPDAANVVSVTVDGDTITPEPGKVPIAVGEDVTIKVTSDVAEEVHVHGYDKMMDLEPGVENKVTFTADIPGLFEVELEDSGTLLLELEVS